VGQPAGLDRLTRRAPARLVRRRRGLALGLYPASERGQAGGAARPAAAMRVGLDDDRAADLAGDG
jgi:hypothetical protein